MDKRSWIFATTLVIGAAAGCAPVVPQELIDARRAYSAAAHGPAMTLAPVELHKAEVSLSTAEEIGAPRQPTAALHLQLAKEQTERARKLIADGDRDRAALVLARAEADANLAIALARTANEQADAQGAINKVYELKGSEK